MIKIILGHEVPKYRQLMETVFRIRYRDFILRRNWSLPTRDGMDIDQYDNDEAMYLLVFRDDGKDIVATARMNQTLESSLLADLFPTLIETGEAPRGPALWEGTRFTLSPDLRSRDEIRSVRGELGCAAAKWVLERGGSQIQAVVDFAAFPAFLEMSTRTRAVGLPMEYGGGDRSIGGGRCIAFRWDLCPELIRDFEAYGRGIDLKSRGENALETIN